MTSAISGRMTCASWRNFKQTRWLNPVRLLVLGVVLLGFAVRLHHLEGDSFWIDEIITVGTARTLSGALAGGRDHPPLIYLLTHFAMRVWGESEFTARLPSLWAGTLALPVLFVLGKRLHRPETGVWATFLLALAPFHLKYAQEARHYAWLLFFTLLAFLLLHRAVTRPSWKGWLLFGLVGTLNLYTHYGAFLVLGAQSFFIAGWLVMETVHGRWRNARFPAGAAALIVLFYLPQLPRFLAALPRNIGAETITDTGQGGTLVEWGRNLLLAFGGGSTGLSVLLTLLAVLGLFWLGRQRRWLSLALLATGLFGPILLIPVVGVARGPFPRYFIYLLPFFLLAAAIPLVAIPRPVRQRNRLAAVAMNFLFAIGFLLLSLPRLQNEYQFVVGDWRGIAAQLGNQPDRPVLALSLNFPNGYNIAAASLPYYLHPEQPLLAGDGGLQPAGIEQLAGSPGVALVVHDWNPGNPLAGLGVPVTEYQTVLYVAEPAGSGLAAAINALQHFIPLADTPVPQCLLRQDLAALLVSAGDYQAAADSFLVALAQCPALPSEAAPQVRQAVRQAIMIGLAETIRTEDSPESAALMLKLDPLHEPALAALTVVDLQAQWAAAEGTVRRQSMAEPIRLESFIMPGSEPVPTLLTHPPAELSFRVDLPAEPLLLNFRAALAPQSWGWGGDGAQFQVSVQPAGGIPVMLYDQFITNDPADQNWHPGQISLAEYAGETVDIILSTGPGPAGDFIGDWAGWADLRLIRDLLTTR